MRYEPFTAVVDGDGQSIKLVHLCMCEKNFTFHMANGRLD